ncbi:glycosyltransferase family 2 protein [Paenibacillus sp. IB182496]|uniref:Glycosyltransferase family 2 protein n=1 Tax=Paenibacillus sabuli TaxID=2772509 RepID=A0A927BSE3_9BACL|nr:glycosyltransferase family 2 protein [Paenibacillus sabuli]MBD2845921.1 glycosyltransferase family 2 protein [Paenibacillus sabuli]
MGEQFLTVVMPVYNRVHTVKNALASILNQTYPHFELIIVDDASKDGTRSIVESFDDPRIRLIAHAATMGAPAARNTGILAAKSEWIAFQDSDDEWLPTKLEKQVQALQNAVFDKKTVVYTGFYRFRGEQREYIPAKAIINKSGMIHEELLLGNFISTQTILVSKAALEEVGGFDENMPRFQDWELCLRLSQKHPFLLVDEPLVHVHYTEQSISASQSKLVDAYALVLKKHKALFQAAGKKQMGRLQFSYGHNLCLLGEIRKGRKQLLHSIKNYPYSIKTAASIGASLLGSRFYNSLYRRLKN